MSTMSIKQTAAPAWTNKWSILSFFRRSKITLLDLTNLQRHFRAAHLRTNGAWAGVPLALPTPYAPIPRVRVVSGTLATQTKGLLRIENFNNGSFSVAIGDSSPTIPPKKKQKRWFHLLRKIPTSSHDPLGPRINANLELQASPSGDYYCASVTRGHANASFSFREKNATVNIRGAVHAKPKQLPGEKQPFWTWTHKKSERSAVETVLEWTGGANNEGPHGSVRLTHGKFEVATESRLGKAAMLSFRMPVTLQGRSSIVGFGSEGAELRTGPWRYTVGLKKGVSVRTHGNWGEIIWKPGQNDVGVKGRHAWEVFGTGKACIGIEVSRKCAEVSLGGFGKSRDKNNGRIIADMNGIRAEGNGAWNSCNVKLDARWRRRLGFEVRVRLHCLC